MKTIFYFTSRLFHFSRSPCFQSIVGWYIGFDIGVMGLDSYFIMQYRVEAVEDVVRPVPLFD